MSLILDELSRSIGDPAELLRVALRLFAAMIAGAVIGYQRERSGKAAGLRTHMLVCMGTALFVIAGTQIDMEQDALSRIIQGLATGIGFLGAGAIIKMEATRRIQGLTTAAGIWMTSAIGVLVGLGRLGTAALAVLLTWIVLAIIVKIEDNIEGNDDLA
jgi:putative Mg2+ transporter-C (MgtC) family protein